MSHHGHNQTQSPGVGKFADTLWVGTYNIRTAIVAGDFIQAIITGTLDPSHFGKFGVQDTLYIYNSLAAINIAKGRAASGSIRACLQRVSDAYANSLSDMKTTWSVADNTGFNLDPTTEAYVNHEHTVATTNPPVYTLVAIYACMRLWPWLGSQMPKENMDVYLRWARLNFNPLDHSYVDVKNAINDAYDGGEIDMTTAQNIFNISMQCERDFFAAFA